MRRALRISGAVSGQLSQAVGSFALQVVASRALGAAGLGTYALLYSVTLMGAAVCSGLIGDSLTVLPREERRVRAGLQVWGLGAIGFSAAAAALAFWLSGFVAGGTALLFGVASALFLAESVLRRLLMAVMSFWPLVAVDAASVATSLGFLAVWAIDRSITLDALLVSLGLGQVVGALVAIVFLPRSERVWAPLRPAAVREVLGFGGWRALQQCIRPAMLTGGRLLVTAAAGRSAFGQLEAARVFMSPALLVVQGLGSYLFSSYAKNKTAAWAVLVRRADRAAAAMLAATLVVGALGSALAPVLGSFVTGDRYSLVPMAVLGWAVYAASSAAVMPFASLAAVRGRQRLVVALRAGDSLCSLLALAIFIVVAGVSVSWTPFVLAVGSFVDGAVIRLLVLEREKRRELARDIGTTDEPDPPT